jgi:hypothetical protein
VAKIIRQKPSVIHPLLTGQVYSYFDHTSQSIQGYQSNTQYDKNRHLTWSIGRIPRSKLCISARVSTFFIKAFQSN